MQSFMSPFGFPQTPWDASPWLQHMQRMQMQSIARPFAGGDLPSNHGAPNTPDCLGTPQAFDPVNMMCKCPKPPPPPTRPVVELPVRQHEHHQHGNFFDVVVRNFANCKDEEDAGELADDLLTAIKEHSQAPALIKSLFAAILADGPAESLVEQARLSKPFIDAFLAPPKLLAPSFIAQIMDKNEQIAAWQKLNIEAVNRCVPLATPATLPFWQRPNIRPVPLSPNERDIMFHLLKHVRFYTQQSEVRELKDALLHAIPPKFRKSSSDTPLDQPDEHGTKRRNEPTPSCEVSETPKRARATEHGAFSISNLRNDVLKLGNVIGDKTLATPSRAMFVFPATDDADPQEVQTLISNYQEALSKFGFKDPLTPSLGLTFEELLKTLGVKPSKKHVDALVGWVARVLAVKNPNSYQF